jgi:hypothetical protein
MAIRRFTRLTNAFSKKLDNHKAACALHFAYYNFCGLHKSPRVTPAMEAGITDHVWTIAELLAANRITFHGNKVLLGTFSEFRRANLRIASKAAD